MTVLEEVNDMANVEVKLDDNSQYAFHIVVSNEVGEVESQQVELGELACMLTCCLS
jgi:hypothetical protein